MRQFVQPGSDTKGLDNLSLDSKQVSHIIFPLASHNQENFPSHSFWKFLALFLVVFNPKLTAQARHLTAKVNLEFLLSFHT